VVAAAAAARRTLVSLDAGPADIRAYPPGTHASIVVLRVPEQSAATVTSAAPWRRPAARVGPSADLVFLRVRHSEP
jgi:hypothetical protein